MLVMRLPDAILFYTNEEMTEYRCIQRTRSQSVFALDNGIETDDIVRLRKPYRSEHRTRDLFFIGRLTPKAGLSLLFEALAQPDCAGVSLDIVGSGETELHLRSLAESLGLSDRVRWHGSTTDEMRIAAIANQCRLFVYPGSVGLSLVHALSYGLPAILHENRREHMPEYAAFKTGVNGLNFPSNEASGLSQVISRALGDSERLNRMSAAAVLTTTNAFNSAVMAERFCAMVEALTRDDVKGR
ncbi:glycosyltransferase [Mesorhizobium shangrilense]|uniref:Glycosyltransferase n=1 Tax=Mesorhizobium shangrilense TaxID=460060 RepID=A0ABV2DCP3_9HYPH